MLKKILVLPGWMTSLMLYEERDDFDTQIGKLKSSSETEYIIGLSLGALVVLRDWNEKGNLILVNPTLPKRNIFIWISKWIKFILSEGLFFRRQKFTKNPLKFIIEIIKCAKLLSVDFSKVLDKISKDRLIMIRGKKDNYFCDQETVEFMRLKKFKVIEIENCGHNWCEETEKVVYGLIK